MSRLSASEQSEPAPSIGRWILVAVGALTLLGLGLRLARFDQSMMGDELSTLWIVRNNDVFGTIQEVATDAEISPPLNFVLAWLATKLGSAPELVRLPALIAGTISIPLTYMVGRSAVGRQAGLVAAAVMALTPFMIFYSTDGRAYALAIALLLGSTLAMLRAAREGGRCRWFLYGLLSCLAIYTHYTAAFVLIAQLLWLLWLHPDARRPALVANGLASVAFLPWLPSLLADTRSPTIDLLAVLQGSGFEAKRLAVEAWAFGHPFVGLDNVPGQSALVSLDQVPGRTAILLIVGGLGAGLAAAAIRWARTRDSSKGRWISDGMLLVLVLALATPVAEGTILLLGGTDLFGARNLNTSSAGLALLIGAVIAASGPFWRVVTATAVLGGYLLAALSTLDADTAAVDLRGAAAFVEQTAEPGDIIVDASLDASITPVPLTALDVHLSRTHSDYSLGLPDGAPPFLPFRSSVPSPQPLLQEALLRAEGHRLILVGPDGSVVRDESGTGTITALTVPETTYEPSGILPLAPGSSLVADRRFRGAAPINVFVIKPGPTDPRSQPGSRKR